MSILSFFFQDKVYTPYDAAVIKGNNEIADYIKSKGGDTGGDIDNLLIAKGIRKSKSAKSRQTLASHPEEEEPADNKKAEEEEKRKLEEEKKKKEPVTKKEKEEAEREKEKFVIVPGEKDKDKKGKEDKKDQEKEKEKKEGKGEKKGSEEDQLKDLQDKIAAGQGDSDEREPNRKPIPVIEPTKEEARKQKKSGKKDQTDEELEEAKRKIAEGQGDADERERKRKEAEEKEAEEKEKSEKEVKKGKNKKEDLSDDELKALQDKIKAGEGEIDERDKKKSRPKEDKKSIEKTARKSAGKDKTEKKSPAKDKTEKKDSEKEKPDLTDKELAAAAVAIVAVDEAKKQKQRKTDKDKEGLDIPGPSESPDLRDPKQKSTKDSREKVRLAKDSKEKEKLAKESKEKDKLEKDKNRKVSKKGGAVDAEETQKRDRTPKEVDELDSEDIRKGERRTREEEEQDGEDSRGRSKKAPVVEVATRKPVATPESHENIRSRRDSPVKDKRSLRSSSPEYSDYKRSKGDSSVRGRHLRSGSTEREEFEFPEDAPENEVDALKRAEERRRDRERSRSRSTDRESEGGRPEPRKFSKVGNDGRIQPGLLGEKNDRNRRLDERDSPSLIDSEDEFIDDPYFGRRIKYGTHRGLVSKRPDNREKVLRDKRRQEMSRASNRTRTTGGVAKMVPLGYSRLETPQRPITRKSSSIQESVRRYQSERTFVRQLHQLKRAQIYTGPMHDIVLFSKMMNVYKNSTINDSELDIESQYLDDWDSYLQGKFLISCMDRYLKSEIYKYLLIDVKKSEKKS